MIAGRDCSPPPAAYRSRSEGVHAEPGEVSPRADSDGGNAAPVYSRSRELDDSVREALESARADSREADGRTDEGTGVLREIFTVLKKTVQEWLDDKASRLAAALSFYATLSLAPLLLLIVSIVGLVIGESETRGVLAQQAQSLVGDSGKTIVDTVFANADHSSGILGTIFGFVILAFGATGVVGQIQEALNTVWGVERTTGSGVWNFARKRLISFVAILAIGLLLLVSLIAGSALSLVGDWIGGSLGEAQWTLRAFDILFSFVVFSILFTFAYKFLPDVKIRWADVWIGGTATAVLFVIGKFLVSIYLGSKGTASAYGAFGSLVIFLIWVYYSAQVMFFGAEFTQVYARRHGSGLEPEEGAKRIPSPSRSPATKV